LLAEQIALSLVLLNGAGLMLETFVKLATVDTGFHKDQVLLIRVYPRYEYSDRPPPAGLSGITAPSRRGARSSVRELCIYHPGERNWRKPDHPCRRYVAKSPSDPVAWDNLVSAGFFATLETPFIVGRDFNEHDTLHAPLVAVIK
jgi:putative ABC transport system permease protein